MPNGQLRVPACIAMLSQPRGARSRVLGVVRSVAATAALWSEELFGTRAKDAVRSAVFRLGVLTAYGDLPVESGFPMGHVRMKTLG